VTEETLTPELGAEAAGEGGTEPFEWAIVEIFGHRQHAGRTREEQRYGAKMLRIDVPEKGDPATHGWRTYFYGGSAIFSFMLSTEETVMRANKPYEPPARYPLPAPEAEGPEFEDGDDEDNF
jgi:hypothetical protein